jgi:hypothetical protein
LSFVFSVVDCRDPGVPRNGYRHGNYYKYDSTINFSCKVQHHLEGAREITCKANGKWSAPTPECLGELLYFVAYLSSKKVVVRGETSILRAAGGE